MTSSQSIINSNSNSNSQFQAQSHTQSQTGKMSNNKQHRKEDSLQDGSSSFENDKKVEITEDLIKKLTPLSLEVIENQATINIGTLGHASHGKSTLVEAISGIKPIKYQMEKERNITIKLGYANFKVFKCKTCPKPICFQSWSSTSNVKPPCAHCSGEMDLLRHFSFVDCPGHDCLMATMLNGAAVMDSAFLLIAANADVPQPQTDEHLAAAEIMKLKHIIPLQSKTDLVSYERCLENHKQIQSFLKGTVAESSIVIPISCRPWQHVNTDVVLQYLVEKVPVPVRNLEAPPLLQIIRSFDVNNPGDNILKLKGGVAGGTLKQGVLKLGQKIEIRPGIIRKSATGEFKCSPIITEVKSLFSEKNSLQFAVPGGLIAVGTTLDPTLTKQDRLVGQVIGEAGHLPDVYLNLEIEFQLMHRVVGSKEEKIKIKKLEKSETILMNIGSTSSQAEVTAVKGYLAKVTLAKPCCVQIGDRVSISRQVQNSWRLIGVATVRHGIPLSLF